VMLLGRKEPPGCHPGVCPLEQLSRELELGLEPSSFICLLAELSLHHQPDELADINYLFSDHLEDWPMRLVTE
jgi:hypothetical protein